MRAAGDGPGTVGVKWGERCGVRVERMSGKYNALPTWARRGWLLLLIAANTMIGLGWWIGSPRRTSADAYAVARLFPGGMDTWGILTIILAAWLAYNLCHPRRKAFAPFGVLCFYWTFWAYLFAHAAFTTPAATAAGPAFTLVMGAAHGMTGLLRREP